MCAAGRICAIEGCRCNTGEVCSDNLSSDLNCSECIKMCNTKVTTDCICGIELCEDTCIDDICTVLCSVDNCEICDGTELCATCKNGF